MTLLELRLKCLEIALSTSGTCPDCLVELAREIEAFVLGDDPDEVYDDAPAGPPPAFSWIVNPARGMTGARH